MNRGSELEGWIASRELLASMRPRFMNRGSGVPQEGNADAALRFNEAPIHESGKSPICQRRWTAPRSFNEAPIHESGKSARQHVSNLVDARFNEAPIHESGKLDSTCET